MEYTFTHLSTGNFKSKGSIFHAVGQPACNVEDVKTKLFIIRKEYSDANHICYAYRIKYKQRLDEFSSDAGEPKGSAGKPILNTLKRNKLLNSVIFVIRYFGGIKLGIPGLINAYKTTAENAIANAKIKLWMEKRHMHITYPYKLEGVIKSILKKNQAEIIHEDFGEKIDVKIAIDVELTDKFIVCLKELSTGYTPIIIK